MCSKKDQRSQKLKKKNSLSLAFYCLIITCLCGFSLSFSYLGFTELLGRVYSCLLSNMGHFDHYFFKYYFCLFSLSSPSGTPIMHMLECLVASHRSLGYLLLLFYSFFFLILTLGNPNRFIFNFSDSFFSMLKSATVPL